MERSGQSLCYKTGQFHLLPTPRRPASHAGRQVAARGGGVTQGTRHARRPPACRGIPSTDLEWTSGVNARASSSVSALWRDAVAGIVAAAVLMTQAMAFGIALYEPYIGSAGAGALAGLMGVAALSLFSGLARGTVSLISGPTGPVMALLARDFRHARLVRPERLGRRPGGWPWWWSWPG